MSDHNEAAVKLIFDTVMAMAEAAWLRYSDEQRAAFTKDTWITGYVSGYVSGALEVMFSV